jgi:hypothetical protein
LRGFLGTRRQGPWPGRVRGGSSGRFRVLPRRAAAAIMAAAPVGKAVRNHPALGAHGMRHAARPACSSPRRPKTKLRRQGARPRGTSRTVWNATA